MTGTNRSDSERQNMLDSKSVMSDEDENTNNISYYQKSHAYNKNSVIDKLLIDRTLAEKVEEHQRQKRIISRNVFKK